LSEEPLTGRARPRLGRADDHPAVAKELRALLQADFDVVGIVGDGRALVAMVEALKPDVVVTDVAMPLLDGVAAVREIRKRDPGIPVVFVTVLTEPEVRQHALATGAVAFLSKASAGDELVPAVRAALLRKREPPAGMES
jgi:DNA-binding NarL/FixJ family response regulator